MPHPDDASAHSVNPVLRLDAASLSDLGHGRAENEDAALIVRPEDPSVLAAKGVLAIVADGMGGHRAGRIASSMAVATVAEIFYGAPRHQQESLAQAFQTANSRIFDEARGNPQLRGMGTTCTALAVCGELAWSAHVGDSRIYLVRGGQAYRMTDDHSATMRLVDLGLLRLDEARRHEHRNVLLRALGTQPALEVSVWPEPFPVRAGDCFVLCSDGLYEVVSDEEIATRALAATTAGEACRQLIDSALSRHCPDNVTVAVLRLAPGVEP
jgi:protein phosphatase